MNWIKNAIRKPGSLRKALHAKKGEDIPVSKLKSVAKGNSKLAKKARLALTLRSFNK